jgi:2'-5' RNA ligase
VQRQRSGPRQGKTGGSPTLGSGRRYLSVVLEVPRALRGRVVARRGGAEGTAAHITVFITERAGGEPGEAELLERVSRACAGVPGGEVELRGTGSFRPVSDVVFLRVGEGAEMLTELHRRCAGMLPDASPFPYHPHFTLAQGLSGPELERAAAELADFQERFEARALGVYGGDLTGWRRLGEVRLG